MKHTIIIIILFSAFGCSFISNDNTTEMSSIAPRTHVLTWTSYDMSDQGRGQEIYNFDGKDIGQGEYGFWRVLAEVSRLPSGSTISIEGEGPSYDPLASGPIFHRPYFDYVLGSVENEQMVDLFDILDLLAKEKGIIIEVVVNNPLSVGTYREKWGAKNNTEKVETPQLEK